MAGFPGLPGQPGAVALARLLRAQSNGRGSRGLQVVPLSTPAPSLATIGCEMLTTSVMLSNGLCYFKTTEHTFGDII
jgi:hypothetical protein